MLIMSFAGLLVLFLVFTVIGIVFLTILSKIGRTMVGTARNCTTNDNNRQAPGCYRDKSATQNDAQPQYAYAAAARPSVASRKSRAGRFFSAVGSSILLVVMLLAVGLVIRGAREVRLDSSATSVVSSFSDVPLNAHDSIREAMLELEDARGTVQQTLKSLQTPQIPVPPGVANAPAGVTESIGDKSLQPAEKNGAASSQLTGLSGEVTTTSGNSKRHRASAKTDGSLDGLVWRLSHTILTHARQAETQKQQQSDNSDEATGQSSAAADLAEADQSSNQPLSDDVTADAKSSDPDEITVAESTDSSVILMELNAETLARLLGNSDVTEANSGIPEGFRRIYALIPLTTAGTQLVSPGGQPLKAVESVQTLAELLTAALSKQDIEGTTSEPAYPAVELSEGAISSATTASASETKTDSGNRQRLAEKPGDSDDFEDKSTPIWVKNPDGGRRVIETAFRPAGEDATALLRQELNHALTAHLVEHLTGSNPEPGNWTRLVKLNLSESAASKCVVATHDRRETITTLEGPQDMVQTFALVEFPEAIDRAAILQIRREVQSQRMICVLFVAALVWLAILSTGLILRFASGGRRLRLVLAIPAFMFISVPLVVLAAGAVIAMAEDDLKSFPWNDEVTLVTINPTDKNPTSSASSGSPSNEGAIRPAESSVTVITSANSKTVTVVNANRKAKEVVKGKAEATGSAPDMEK